MRFFIDTQFPDFDFNLKMIGVAKKAFDMFEKNTKSDKAIYGVIEQIRSIPVVLKINKRLKNSAGRAWCSIENNAIIGLTVDINPQIFKLGAKLIYEIISHEIAHCIDFIIRGNSLHDKQWKAIHKLMGGTGNRYVDITAKITTYD